MTNSNPSLELPDVAKSSVGQLASTLDWVGMSGIEVPVLWKDQSGQLIRIPAKAQAFVSLDVPTERGIHMSRLFKITQELLSANTLSLDLLKKALSQFLETHQGLSKSARLSVEFEALVLRKALKSDNRGWRSYPVKMMAETHGDKVETSLEVEITYSSTCPASAALARSLIQENFKSRFEQQGQLNFENIYQWLGTTQGILATPHAQRSFARVEVQVLQDFEFEQLIDLLENTLQTPVQSVVKRQDEQEFALRNGQNLMFCEDAARRLKAALALRSDISGFKGQVRHIESLHPHDAVAHFSK